MSTATETAARILEALPSETQERPVERLREWAAEEDADARWDAALKRKPETLKAMARAAREAIARGEAEPMEYDDL